MTFIKERTPKMAEGMEKKLMSYVLGRVKVKEDKPPIWITMPGLMANG